VARIDRTEPPVPTVRTVRALGPAAATGVRATALGMRRPLRTNTGSAIVAITVVTMTAVAAIALVASYDALISRPAEFGAPWDAAVGNIGSPAELQQAAATLDAIPGVRAAAGIVDLDSFLTALAAAGAAAGAAGARALVAATLGFAAGAAGLRAGI